VVSSSEQESKEIVAGNDRAEDLEEEEHQE
jgi:hypothetical protein